MSTPVFEEDINTTTAEVDLTVRMQHMIDLQNDQIKMSQDESQDPAAYFHTGSRRRGEPPESTVPISSSSGTAGGARSSLGTKTMSRSVRLSSLHDFSRAHEEPIVGDLNQLHSQEEQTTSDNYQIQPGVGTGTLYFNTEKLGSAASAGTQSISRSDESSRPVATEDRRLLMPVPVEKHGMAYGSVEVPPPPPPPPSSSLPGNSNYEQNANQYQGQPYSRPPQYQYPPSQHDPRHTANTHQQQSGCDAIVDALRMSCTCLWNMVCGLFCCCATDVEQLQRSFCYGAIDGMLTGSGIVAAFCGMNVLAPTSTLAIRTFVVAFSAAACFADSLCMALGHVWTTHVLVSAQARERTATRSSVDQNKADAKGKLVDMLLERGMLKIDAMSLADTLEGYPDLFVSALVGDALIAGGVGGGGNNADSSLDLSIRGHRSVGTGGKGSPSASRAWSSHHWNGGEDYTQHMAEQDSAGNGNFMLWKFPSYGQHISELDQEIDPEAAVVGAAMAESRREGLFMMIGFSLFAVVPSLIYLVCPVLSATARKPDTTELNSGAQLNGGSTSTTSVVITTAAVIMWCLGVWKSRFLDSNWMMFGIETVVVMLVCISAAYGVGSVLRTSFPGLDALTAATSTIDISSADI